MWMLQNKKTGNVIDPRVDFFALSPSDLVEGATDWDEVFATDSETDLIEGYARVDINKDSDAYQTGYEAAAQGEPVDANPYAAGTWGAANWAAGWNAE